MQAEATFLLEAATSRTYAVLARVSPSYSPLLGRSPTCYSPVRRSTFGPKADFALDLHVLSTPPAFILSQDQTLQLNPARPDRSPIGSFGMCEWLGSALARPFRAPDELTLTESSIQFSKNRGPLAKAKRQPTTASDRRQGPSVQDLRRSRPNQGPEHRQAALSSARVAHYRTPHPPLSTPARRDSSARPAVLAA